MHALYSAAVSGAATPAPDAEADTEDNTETETEAGSSTEGMSVDQLHCYPTTAGNVMLSHRYHCSLHHQPLISNCYSTTTIMLSHTYHQSYDVKHCYPTTTIMLSSYTSPYDT